MHKKRIYVYFWLHFVSFSKKRVENIEKGGGVSAEEQKKTRFKRNLHLTTQKGRTKEIYDFLSFSVCIKIETYFGYDPNSNFTRVAIRTQPKKNYTTIQ